MIGYNAIKVNIEYPSGKFTFGTWTVPLFEGPVYVEECLPDKLKPERTVKVSLEKIGQVVHPLPAPKSQIPVPPEK